MKFAVPAIALAAALLVLAAALLVLAAGCGNGGPDTTVVGFRTVKLLKTADGLQYYDINVGTGASPKAGQTLSVTYTGTLQDGTEFDSTDDHGGKPFTFQVGSGQVIKGWDEGVLSMRVGGKRRLVIPGSLAYGPNPPDGSSIPPNATLIFDIELVSIQP